MQASFVDIHCHLLPEIDDGATDWETSLQMARMAVADGIHTVVVTPHQLGSFAKNLGPDIRRRTAQLQQLLNQQGVSLKVLPGGDVRIEEGMVEGLLQGEILTLGDHGRHVLLELPHELYFPLDHLLKTLAQNGITGILSHPERNQGILSNPEIVPRLVQTGCLMQITAGSLMGTFGPQSKECSEWMLKHALVHFVATDAHGVKARRPLLRRAYERVATLMGEEVAKDLCVRNPSSVARGVDLTSRNDSRPKRSWQSYFFGKRAG